MSIKGKSFLIKGLTINIPTNINEAANPNKIMDNEIKNLIISS
jgi:hypothetical protein